MLFKHHFWRFSVRFPINGWAITLTIIALIMLTPILVVISSLFQPFSDTWGHLFDTVLPRYINNSLILMVGVGCGVTLLGVSTAWLMSMTQFWGRGQLEWLLLLPLAFPAYILAYAYTDLLQYSGPVQGALRDWFGWTRRDYWFPEIRSRGGAIIMLTLALYPYVYMLTRSSFLEQSVSVLEASRSLGRNVWGSFVRVSLPLARPAIVAGVALALMETLSDYGTVDYFSVQTFTTGIYRTWFGMGERVVAAQLSSMLLLFVMLVFTLERLSRRRSRHQRTDNVSRYKRLPRYPLSDWRGVLAFCWCGLPILAGFILPVGVLLNLALKDVTKSFSGSMLSYARNSLSLALITALLAVLLALILAYGVRLNPKRHYQLLTRVASLGYAVPGSVIGVGILMTFGGLDRSLNVALERLFHIDAGLLLSGTMAGLIFAYLVRFLAVAHGGIEASLSKITPSMDDAARSFGYRTLQALYKVHIPMLRSSLLTAGLLVFVDVTKELPATLIIRPFNLDTLAIRVYRLASDERLLESSGSALMIVGVSLVPVIVLSLAIARSRER